MLSQFPKTYLCYVGLAVRKPAPCFLHPAEVPKFFQQRELEIFISPSRFLMI